MELFEEIRREYEFGVGTVAGVARRFGVHRRMVREALEGAVPKERAVLPRRRPKIGPVATVIDGILEADRQVPRKQRHTAHRIWTRLREAYPAVVIGESTVRQYVRERKRALGFMARATCVPQQYAWGGEAQVDWYVADAVVDGTQQTWQVFAMRSMASGAAFHRAYPRATQQAFLEAHELAFRHFGGVFRRVRYDNLPAAVGKVLRGYRREETARFVAFRSHWRFEALFCTPGEAHEKGGIENEVGTFRRRHWVPLPVAGTLAELNAYLLACCREDEGRVLRGREQPVGALLLLERDHLVPLAAEGVDLAETSFATVDALGRVRVHTNAYSVPLSPGTPVRVAVLPAVVEVWHGGRCIARHARCYGRHQEVLDLEHYLDVLAHKPGALAGSTPLAQWRRSGRWPESYDRFWQALVARQGRQVGTKAMIALLQLGRRYGYDRLHAAIETALARGCHDGAAVHHLLRAEALSHAQPAPLDVGLLGRFDRPAPSMAGYDQLRAEVSQ